MCDLRSHSALSAEARSRWGYPRELCGGASCHSQETHRVSENVVLVATLLAWTGRSRDRTRLEEPVRLADVSRQEGS